MERRLEAPPVPPDRRKCCVGQTSEMGIRWIEFYKIFAAPLRMKMLMDRWRGGKAARIIVIMLMITVTPGGAGGGF